MFPYRYFPQALCLYGLFDYHSTVFPSAMPAASSGFGLVAPSKLDGFLNFSLPHRSLSKGCEFHVSFTFRLTCSFRESRKIAVTIA